MKPSKTLAVLGNPVAFYPGIVPVTGSIKATLMFCQIFYWSQRTAHPLGVYKSVADFEDEIHLTYKEQIAARKRLVDLGLISEEYDRAHHRVYFLVDLERLDELLLQQELAYDQKASAKMEDGTCQKVSYHLTKGNVANTKTTAKNTTSNDGLPDCPHQQLIELFASKVPELPKPRIWTGSRQKDMLARWRWVMSQKAADGAAKHQQTEDGVQFFARFFDYVASSDFLTGRSGVWEKCDLPWLMKEENFAKVIEGNYENQNKGA